MDYSVNDISNNSDTMIIPSESSPETTNSVKHILNFSVDRLLSCDRDRSDKKDTFISSKTSTCSNNSHINKCHAEEILNLDETGNKVLRPMPIRIGPAHEHRSKIFSLNSHLYKH